MQLAKPARTEHYFQSYIDAAPDGEILEGLQVSGAHLVQQVRSWPEEFGSHRYAPDKWSVKEVLGHIADGERIFGYRLLWIAREGIGELPGFDQDPFVVTGRFDRLSLSQLARELEVVRAASVSLLETLPPLDWSAPLTIADNPMTPAHIPWLMVGHQLHHQSVLAARYDPPA